MGVGEVGAFSSMGSVIGRKFGAVGAFFEPGFADFGECGEQAGCFWSYVCRGVHPHPPCEDVVGLSTSWLEVWR